MRLPASKHGAVNKNCTPCYIKQGLEWNSACRQQYIPPLHIFQDLNRCFICQHYGRSRRRRSAWNEVPALAAGEILPPFFVSGTLWRGFAARPGNRAGRRAGARRKGRGGAISGRSRVIPCGARKILNKNPYGMHIFLEILWFLGVHYQHCNGLFYQGALQGSFETVYFSKCE